MTDDELHAIHAAAMTLPRPWSATDIGVMRRAAGIVEVANADGFLLARITLDEAELLTLAVHPGSQRRGIGRVLLDEYHRIARSRGAHRSCLDVAETNRPARALYVAAGYAVVGRRAGYYTEARPPADAILMSRPL